MAENTKIEWAHHTFNPWYGCQRVGPGCDHCYAEGWAKRSGLVQWGAGADRRRSSDAIWKKPLKWNAEAERLGVRYRVFCASLADVFDNAVPASWRADLFQLIERTPHLDWLVVTKRVGNVAPMMLEVARQLFWLDHLDAPHLPSNVWLGITVVNQQEADRDIPRLLALPARVRFLSVEPLLGPVDLRFHIFSEPTGNFRTHAGKRQMELRKPADGGLHWVIVGGESGHGARPMHPNWARRLRDQCLSSDVAFLFKQWGEWAPRSGLLTGGGTDFVALDPECKRWPHVTRLGEHGLDTRTCENCTPDAGEDIYMQRVGKQQSGRSLDGLLHDGYPEAAYGL